MQPPELLDEKLQRAQRTVEKPLSAARWTMRATLDLVLTPVRTFASLFRRPGETMREHVFAEDDARHDRVAGPFFIAFLGVTLMLLANASGATAMESFVDPLIWFKNILPYAAPILLLPVSALQQRLFRRKDISFGETYSFGLYAMGAISVFHAALVLARRYSGFAVYNSNSEAIVNIVVLAIDTAYVGWAATGFYGSRRVATWVKGAISFLTFAGIAYGIFAGIVAYTFRHMLGGG